MITGASGQLGNSLKKLFSSKYDLIPTYNINSHKRNKLSLDISNSLMTKDLVSAISPDVIINLAAITNVDLCESNPRLAHAINFQGVKNLVNTFKYIVSYYKNNALSKFNKLLLLNVILAT